MKLKKLFAGVVAVAMMATMAFPAFATEGGGTTEVAPTTAVKGNIVNITKTYEVAKGTAPAETFKFKVEKDTSVKDNTYNENTTAPEVPEEYKEFDLPFNGGESTQTQSKAIDFRKFGFTHVGKYYYTISELIPDDKTPGIAYDAKSVEMSISVVNNADYNGFEYYVTLTKDGQKIGADKAFKNIYGKDSEGKDTVYDLSLTKTVSGDFADRGKYFEFEIKLTAEDGKTKYAASKVTLNVTDEKNKTNTTDPVVIGGKAATVYLKHDQTVTLSNLPKNVKYEITEKTTGYTLSYLEDSAAPEGIITANTAVKAHNTHEGVPDTGVILDNAPYILMLAVVAGAAMTLVIKKRREEE